MANAPKRLSKPGDVLIEDAKLRYLNFAGVRDLYNAEGDRNFQVILPEDLAMAMAEDGWNVKETKLRKDATEDEIENFVPRPFVKVNVSYRYGEPQVTIVTGKSRKNLRQSQVGQVDRLDIKTCDVKISGSVWGPNAAGDSGITAYLEKIYIVVNEDHLDAKYADLEDTTDYSGDEPEDVSGGGPRFR